MAMDSFYQSPYVQNQMKFETYQPQILMKPRTASTNQDYSMPLHVDCSVEYELPDCAKPPQGVKIEPLLMIHPCHFRNLERQRRRPFENNMPPNSLLVIEQLPPKQHRVNNNLPAVIQKQQQHNVRNTTVNNNSSGNGYNCNFVTSHNNNNNIIDYQSNHGNNNDIMSNNSSNLSNHVQRFRNNGNNVIRNHPYAMPCAPRYPDIHYSTSHLPTLIYNV